MTISTGFLVVMTKLDNDVVARLQALEHLIPTPLTDKGERRATVDSVVIDKDVIVEIALKSHAPAALLFAFRDILIGSGRVADDKDCRGLIGYSRRQQQQG